MVYKKMKIGIVTFWESNDNYGQQLQCWALQQYLRKMGHEPFLIRTYAWPIPKEKKLIKRIKQLIKNKLIEFLLDSSLAYKPFVYNRFKSLLYKEAVRRKFPQFRKEHLNMSRIYYTPSDLVHNSPKADVYITGSDQVWNYVLPSDVYAVSFLQFGSTKTKRIAYAPSIARMQLSEEIKPVIAGYLQSFAAISVRENSAVTQIQELGYEVTRVLDPSMLLTADDYKCITSAACSKPNVYVYSMNYASADDVPIGHIKTYAERRHLPILVTPGSGFIPARELFDGVKYSYATIPEWIQHIAQSELVVTASFHGVVFAILFHRPFIYTPLKGNFAESNNRVLDLLKDLDLEDRMWHPESNDFETIISSDVNWEEADVKLATLRSSSSNFLYNALTC